jgi:hypothetical protein
MSNDAERARWVVVRRDAQCVIDEGVLTRPWGPCLQRMRYEPEPGAVAPPRARAAPRRTSTPTLPDRDDHAAVAAVVSDTLRTALEVLDGRRPHSQITSAFAPRAATYWSGARKRRGPGRTRLQRVHVCLPWPGVAEVAAVILDGNRVRAVPARFERNARGTWRCTYVRII